MGLDPSSESGPDGLDDAGASVPDRAELARSLAFLFTSGATLGLISLALPHARVEDELGLAGTIVVAYAMSVPLLLLGRMLPPAAYRILATLGTGLVTAAVYFSGEGSSVYAMFYIWVGLYAFYFFSTAQAIVQSALIGAAYAAVLAFGVPSGAPLARWLVTVGTVFVAGALISRLSARVRQRAEESARQAERLRDVEARTRSIIDGANEAFVAMDEGGAIVGWNPQAEVAFGWSRTRALGQPLVELIIPAPNREAFQAELGRLRRSEDDALPNGRIELDVLHRDGHQFPAELSLTTIPGEDGVTLNAFIHDISERKEAEAEVLARAEDMAVVAHVVRQLASVNDAHAARVAICEAAVGVARCKVAILFEADPQGRELISTAMMGSRAAPIRLPFAGHRSGAAVAFSSGQPFFAADLVGHPAVSQRTAELLGVVSALWQPVLRNGLSIGVLTVAWEDRVEDLSERLSSLMDLLGAEAAVAIERSDLLTRLETVARTDELTGLANRRAWEEALSRELARAEREDQPMCVAMLDLDYFKRFNDEHGHQAGDRLLKQLAATWRQALRPTDVLARYGGEEFVVLLPNCHLARGIEVIERLREATPERATCSAGVVRYDGSEAPEALVSRADDALYRAKREGRDRIVASS
ncbi:MAG: diguanylate cyclase [Actinomycetota bacterium]|nr:diguanylate cyclase [Actinomycetota bacterium]